MSGRDARQEALFLATGRVESSDPLVAFLYLLLRDAAPAGLVLQCVQDVKPGNGQYTNGHLARYAEHLAAELRARGFPPAHGAKSPALLQAARQAHAALQEARDELAQEASNSAHAYCSGSPRSHHDEAVERIHAQIDAALAALKQAGAKPEEGEGNG